MTGAVLAVISAAIFGFQNAAARRAVVSATPLQGMMITVPPMVPFLAVICYAMNGFAAMTTWPAGCYALAGLAGVMHFVIGRNSNYHSMRALGSTLSTPIQQLSTVFSLCLAVGILHESLSGLNIVGIILVSIGPALLIGRRKALTQSKDGSSFVPDLRTGVLHGFVCVIGYGSSPILIVLSLQFLGPDAPKLANSTAILFFSYFCAAICVGIMGGFQRDKIALGSMQRSGFNWFLLSGIMIAVSQVFRYGALAFAPVAVVVPIQRLSVIFRLLFNAVINRAYERFDPSIVLGIFLSVIGVAALGIDTETALGWLSLPPGLSAVLNWRL